MSTQSHWIEQYKKRKAFWMHGGNSKQPHALLTSGKHSNGFFNSGLITEDPKLLDAAARKLCELLKEQPFCMINRVVGPAMGAITLAHDVGRLTDAFTAYAEKTEIDGKKAMVFTKSRVLPNENILLAEDVLSTGGSVELLSKAAEDAGGVVLPFVLALVNRSGLTHVGDRRIIALVDTELPMWEEGECPLCKKGSKAIRPKGENWALLNKDYG